MDFRTRQKKLRDHLATTRFDGLLISHLPNIRYLCGFTGSAGLLLVEQDENVFFTDVRYDIQAHAGSEGRQSYDRAQGSAGGAWGVAGEEAQKISRTDDRDRSPNISPFREKAFRPASAPGVRLKECACHRGAVSHGQGCAKLLASRLRLRWARTCSSVGLKSCARESKKWRWPPKWSTPPAGVGRRRCRFPLSSLPEPDRPCRMDELPPSRFARRIRGLRLRCYTLRLLFGSDPHCVGRRSSEDARRAYEAVREAQQAAIDAVRPGIAVGEVDAAARKVLTKAGLARHFTHSTGHGVGLEIHEAPRVAAGQRESCGPVWSSRSSREYTSPANGA